MTDDKLRFDSERQERDATRLLPSLVLSPTDRNVVANRIVDIARKYNPVELLTGFAFPSLLLHPADSHPVFIEYLQHIIITHTPVEMPAKVSEDLEGLRGQANNSE